MQPARLTETRSLSRFHLIFSKQKIVGGHPLTFLDLEKYLLK